MNTLALQSFNGSVIYPKTQCNIPEEFNLQQYGYVLMQIYLTSRSENLPITNSNFRANELIF